MKPVDNLQQSVDPGSLTKSIFKNLLHEVPARIQGSSSKPSENLVVPLYLTINPINNF